MFALAVAVGPGSSGHSVAHGTASPGATVPASPSVTAPATAGTVPAQDSASAKLAAETIAAANPVADALGSAQQPSWSAKPRVMRYLGYQFKVPSSWPDLAQPVEQLRFVEFQNGGIGQDQINGDIVAFGDVYRFTAVASQQSAHGVGVKDFGYGNKNQGFLIHN